jgi:Replication-relaxation
MAKPFILTPRFEEILRTVYFYRYMTAFDVAYRLFSPGSLTYVREILKVLCGGGDYIDNQYLFRFPLPQFSSGKAERVFTLGSRGRSFLVNSLGLAVDWYFKPHDTKRLSYGLIVHNLTLTRFIVAAHCLNNKETDTKLIRTRISYEIEKTKGVKVIPDGWLLFEKSGSFCPILLEIDRGSAYKKDFKEHIKSRIEFIKSGAYEKMFGLKGGLIAYATTGELPEYKETRVKFMRLCSLEALSEMNMKSWASILRFTGVERRTMYESPLFGGPVWLRPDSDSPLPLLEG